MTQDFGDPRKWKLKLSGPRFMVGPKFLANQEINLSEGTLDINFSFLEIKTGAISQSYLDSPLLAGDAVFLGIREKITFGQDINIYFSSQQSIPYNQTLNRRSGGIEEGTPTFFYHEV